jgi:threonine aldolase
VGDLPDPPAVSFASDNAAGVAPAVMTALASANTPAALAYGDDRWTRDLTVAFQRLFDAPVEVLVCWGGTGANVVGLASMLSPWQAVICTDQSHIVTDEGGSPTRFIGSMLLAEPTSDGKLDPAAITRRSGWAGSVHHPQPAVVSISQTTEFGTVYSTDEIGVLADAAHAAGMLVHLDGARIANAVAATGDDLVTMVRDTGVDVMTFGATKNGAMYGEAVVYLRTDLAASARFHHKQAAQLPSKMRFVSAQMLALLDGDLWVANAAHANAMARLLADAVGAIEGIRLVGQPEANAVFVTAADDLLDRLAQWSFFWRMGDAGLARWMTSFSTTPEDVATFAEGVRVLASR